MELEEHIKNNEACDLEKNKTKWGVFVSWLLLEKSISME
jgi:hypothetical protein